MKGRFNFFVITAIVMLFAVAADVFIVFQLQSYETRFFEIYGEQQDGYVQIILDQINRLDDSGTDEDITEIISSLDATASRYWTLSKGDSILFVKSVTETNRYKGFTDGTYYATESAMEFLNSLAVNQVEHSIIYLDGDRFIASGVVFEWQGERYKICLLTYDKAILEDNTLLECKNAIIIVLSIVLAVLVILSMLMSRKISRQEADIKDREEHSVWQNQQIVRLDEELKKESAFSASKNVFKEMVLEEFLDTLDDRDVYPLHFAVFEVKSEEAREEFLERMQVVLDKHVLRFEMDNGMILLIFAKYDKEDGSRIIESLEDYEVHGGANLYCEDNMIPYRTQFRKFWKAVTQR